MQPFNSKITSVVPRQLSRRELLRLCAGASLLLASDPKAMAASATPVRRPIPSSRETLPAVGLGAWQTFDVGGSESERGQLRQVLSELVKLGGSVVDSSPMYGSSESVVGDLAAGINLRQQLFLATKIWTDGREAGIQQMQQSLKRLRTDYLDLMQVHNLLDWRTHLVTLRQWKDQGKIRYIGVTHYTESAYDELARVLKAEALDFVQINYSIVEREADRKILPLAQERRLGVLVNRPFAQAALFSKVRDKPLPTWAKEIGCGSWAQFFLKFVISHPGVTCAIPGTSNVEHLRDNMRPGTPPFPDRAMRERMAHAVAEL